MGTSSRAPMFVKRPKNWYFTHNFVYVQCIYEPSQIIEFLEYIPWVLNESLFGSLGQIFFKTGQRHVIASGLLNPLEIKLKIVSDMFLDVQFVDGQTIGHIHCSLSQFSSHVSFFKLIVLLRNGIVCVFHNLNNQIVTNR